MIQRSLFVVKLGGALLDDSAALAATIDSICALHTTRPGSVIVVHGGGSSVDRHLARLGMPTEKRDGIRLTPPDQMIEISAVLSGRVNATIVRNFSQEDLRQLDFPWRMVFSPPQ